MVFPLFSKEKQSKTTLYWPAVDSLGDHGVCSEALGVSVLFQIRGRSPRGSRDAYRYLFSPVFILDARYEERDRCDVFFLWFYFLLSAAKASVSLTRHGPMALRIYIYIYIYIYILAWFMSRYVCALFVSFFVSWSWRRQRAILFICSLTLVSEKLKFRI